MRVPMTLTAIALGMALVPAAASAQTVAEDEQALMDLETHWSALIAAKDVEGIVNIYAEDGMILAPGAPIVSGTDGIREFWTGLLGAPGMQGVLTPVEAHVAASQDLGYDRGTYVLTLDGENGEPVVETGKYVIVWKKVDGQWKAATDTFNSDGD